MPTEALGCEEYRRLSESKQTSAEALLAPHDLH